MYVLMHVQHVQCSSGHLFLVRGSLRFYPTSAKINGFAKDCKVLTETRQPMMLNRRE